MIEVLGKIGFDWQVALANLINFLIIVALVYGLIMRPLRKAMAERKAKIDQGLEKAQAGEKMHEDAQDQAQALVREARQEATMILEKAKADAESRKETLVADAEKRAQEVYDAGVKQIDADRDRMQVEFQKEAAGLVVSATRKLTGDLLEKNPDAAQKMAEDALSVVAK